MLKVIVDCFSRLPGDLALLEKALNKLIPLEFEVHQSTTLREMLEVLAEQEFKGMAKIRATAIATLKYHNKQGTLWTGRLYLDKLLSSRIGVSFNPVHFNWPWALNISIRNT
jgi:hypothetical protein